MNYKGSYTETFDLSTPIRELYRKFQPIYPNQGAIQKVSAYLPKSGSYTESSIATHPTAN